MTGDEFRSAILRTRTLLELPYGRAVQAKRWPEHPTLPEHLSWMLAQCGEFVDTGRYDKANRWLGFVQGVLATRGASLEDLKRANMPEGASCDPERV